MIGPLPCAYACAYVDPVFTSQSYDISIITSTRTNLFVYTVLMLMSTQSSLAYTSACAYAYTCALVKNRLKQRRGDVDENGEKAIGLDWQNNNSARASSFCVHFFAVTARLRCENA